MDRLEALTARFAEEPLAALFGLKLLSLKRGKAVLGMTVAPQHCIVGGIAQGGVTTVLADYAGVYAAMTMIPSGHTPAWNITTILLRPVKEGETVTARARVIGETRGHFQVGVRVTGAGRKTKALVSITFAKPRH